MVERLSSVPCAICGKPVQIEECKSNEIGEPVHEACYVAQLNAQMKKWKAALDKRRLG